MVMVRSDAVVGDGMDGHLPEPWDARSGSLGRESAEPIAWSDPRQADKAEFGARRGQATADLLCAMSAIHEAAARVQGAWIYALTSDPALLERLAAAGHALRRAATLLECDAAIGATIPPTRAPAAPG
jgi:hypothetical protein